MLRDGPMSAGYGPESNRSELVLHSPESVHQTPGDFLGQFAGNAIQATQVEEIIEGPTGREHEIFSLKRNPLTYEVEVNSEVTKADYQRITHDDDWSLYQESLDPLRGKKIVFVGATYEGGGVAMIRPPLIHAYRQEGVDAHWAVLEPYGDAFAVTKKMHNLQQNVAGPGVEFTEEDRQLHQMLGITNFDHLKDQEYFQDADYYVIDDPQPAAMIPLIREHYPNAKIVYRNHIQTDRDLMADEGSQQNNIYRYLHEVCGVDEVDAYIAHPVEDFVPYGTPNVVYMPPTSDPYEDLNRELTDNEIERGLDFFDAEIVRQNEERRVINGNDEDDQRPLDRDRPRITLFARFDLAKGMHIGMELQKTIHDKMVVLGVVESQIPETLIAGNGSVDDLDRQWMLDKMHEVRREQYTDVKDYIKVLGVSHDYAAVNAIMRTSMFSTNPSVAEGFEHRANESIIKDVPAIVSNRGGLPLQVEDGVSGFILNLDKLSDPNDLSEITDEIERIADHVVECIINPAAYNALKTRTKQKSKDFNEREIGTVSSVIRWSRTLQGVGNRNWLLDDIRDEIAGDIALAA